ncbi:MAG: hypothetical protein Q8O88_03785 [bacterium]|nr:hypothetical protein [bacterium]
MKKKNYIIVGDNNYWYHTTGLVTKKQLEAEIEEIKQNISDNIYRGDHTEPEQLFAYEVGRRQDFKFKTLKKA